LSDISTLDKEILEKCYFNDDDDTEDFVIRMRNPNTVRKTTGCREVVYYRLQSTGKMRSIEEILPNNI